MSDADGSDGGGARKRPWDPSQSPQPKKKRAKKLSLIAMRALAAMESDDDDSISSEGETTARARDSQHIETGTLKPSSIVDDTEDEKAGAGENITCHNFAPRANDKDKELNIDDDTENKDECEESQHGQNRQTPATEQCFNNSKSDNDGYIALPINSDVVARGANDTLHECNTEELNDASPAIDGDDFVRPHEVGNDILSSFFSTPFDDKAMMTLHKSKEGIAHGSEGSKTLRGCVSEEYLPIIPQKEFVKRKRDAKQLDFSHNATVCDANPSEAAAIRAEVYSFLLTEGQALINSLPSSNVHTNSSKQHQEIVQCPREPSIQQQLQQPPNPQLRSQPTQQLQVINNYGGAVHQSYLQHNSYYSGSMNSYNAFPPQMPHGRQPNNGWQYPQHFPAPANNFATSPRIRNTYNNPTFVGAPPAATQFPAPSARPVPPSIQGNAAAARNSLATSQKPIPKVVTASAEIKLTDSNRNEVAQLPVAFGYLLDKMYSTTLAEKATKKWVKEGTFAAKSESYKQGREPQKPRRSPPSQPAGPEFPDGWTTKTFQRRGNTPGNNGTYTNFYSPVTMRTFRSKKGAREFIKILNEPGINGDENVAFDMFKRRGHKL